jgi:predicted ATPase/class 3 adenylate cyclase
VRRELPSGTVTFLFTDVEGSTKLLHQLGAEEYARVLAEHRRVLREAFAANQGVEVDTQGDAFFVAFPTALGALRAAAEGLERLAAGPIRVRMGVHTGTPHLAEEGYVGVDVHRAARIAACGHGGQVLVSASAAALVGTDGLRDLGEHRLKDLSAPERIYQLGDRDFRPLRSLHRTNLPIPATPFLGRERELHEVHELVSRADVRLLTLTGPGGTGKTRLALQAVAEEAERYPGGVFWVPLAPLRDPRLVLETVGSALGARNGLVAHIGDAEMLLLFDNFEHVVEAATDLVGLLAACPRVDLVVTSREPLHVTGEREYSVPSLAPEEGVDFFAARARAVKPDFGGDDAVAEICRRLDDLPLALELAAARVKALSPAQILERLEQRLPLLTGGARDAPERQRTLRATIEWSYDLLADEEKSLFVRLAVFRGGCTLDAAEEVADANLDALQSLVDKSLVRHAQERFWMLETIREYGAERLEHLEDAGTLRRRHAEYFLRMAEEAEPKLKESQQGPWLDRLEAEHENLRLSMDFLRQAGPAADEFRLIGALARFWYLRAHLREGSRRSEEALAAHDDQSPLRLKVLYAAMLLDHRLGDYERADSLAKERLDLARRLEDAEEVASALLGVGLTARALGDNERAVACTAESAELARAGGYTWILATATNNLGWFAEEDGDHAHARARYEEALALVAVARKLVVLAWHMLTKKEDYRWASSVRTSDKVPRPRTEDRRSQTSAGSPRPATCAANAPGG